MHKLIGWVLGLIVFGLLIGAALGQDGPLRNAANQLVRTDGNGYLLTVNGQYTSPDGPLQTFANTLVRTDANGYLLIAFANGLQIDDWFRLRTVNTAAPASTNCDAVAETGRLHWDSTNDAFRLCSGASGWVLAVPAGGSAPVTSGYWLDTADSVLSAERNLGALTTGLVLNTVTAGVGVPSAYGGTSCTNQFARSMNASGAATCASVSLTADVTGDLPFANVAQIATASVLGRNTALTGDIEVLATLPSAVQDNITRLGTLAAGAVPASLVTAGTFGVGAYVMDTSLSTPSLLSTGALTVTPAAGSNLNVALSTTGDFAVNTNDLYVDTSTGNVGIGLTNPLGTLTVDGSARFGDITDGVTLVSELGRGNLYAYNITATEYNDLWIGTGADPIGVMITTGGKVGIGRTVPNNWLDLYNSAGGTEFTDGIRVRRGGVATQYGTITQVGGVFTLTSVLEGGGDAGEIFFQRHNAGSGAPTVSVFVNKSGNVAIGTIAVPTTGTAGLVFGDGTALSGMGLNTAGCYGDDVTGTVEVFCIDEGGAATQQTPHNFTLFTPEASEEYPSSYYSRHDYLGVEVAIDTFKLARLVQTLTAQQLIYRRTLPTRRDWVDDQETNMRRAMAAYEKWQTCEPTPDQACGAAPRYPIVKRPPTWMEDRLRAKGWLNTVKAQALRDELRGWCTARGRGFGGATCA